MYNRNLSLKQKKFADCYLLTNDRNKALEAGGYSLKNPSVCASQLLSNLKIKAYLNEASKKLLSSNLEEIYSIVKRLDKKDEACAEVWKAYEAIQDPKNPTKFKWFELLCKLKGHFNESVTQNLFIKQDGSPLSVSEIMEGTSRLTGVMREIRFEAEIMKKNKAEEKVSQVVDITPVNDGLHNID